MLVLVTALPACETSELVDSSVQPGTIEIDISPDGLNAPWQLEAPSGDVVSGFDDTTLRDQAPGDYVLTYDDVPGYGTPARSSGTLRPGAALRFSEEYVARAAPTGSVKIDPDPDELVAEWSLITPDTTFLAGAGDSLLSKLEVGEYYLWWSQVEGWLSPSPNPAVASLETGTTLEFAGTYLPIDDPLGTVLISPSPDGIDPPWILRGPNGFSARGTGQGRLAGRAVGEYSVEWQDHPGYRTPEAVNGTLAEGDSLQLEGTYVLAIGTVDVDVSPDGLGAGWTIYRNEEVVSTGVDDAVLPDIPAGEYTIHWGAVDGWMQPEPNPTTVTLSDGEYRTVLGPYEERPPAVGTVIVRVSPDRASWALSGPRLSEVGLGDARFENVEPGEYEITWQPLSGYSPPDPANDVQTLEESGTVTFSSDYVLPGDPVISSVETTGEHGASVLLTGSHFGSHDRNIEWTGDRIEATPVGTNPNIWPNWTHYQPSGSSELNHVTDQMSWSGAKCLDLEVDQVNHCGGASCYSHLSYDIPQGTNWDKIFISYWFRVDGISGTDSYASKHLWITNSNPVGTSPFQTVRNAIVHTGTLKTSSGTVSTWSTGTLALYGCDNLVCYPSCDPWLPPAAAVGYSMSSENYFRVNAFRGASQSLPEYSYNENEWVRLDYYYDRGDFDTYNGEHYNATFRPEGQGTQHGFQPGLYIGKWVENTLMKSSRGGCLPFNEPNIVGFYLFTDNNQPGDPNTRHTLYWVDDVYIQVGTRARIVLGDSPIYADCTQQEIQYPTQWSDGSIEFQLNYGGGFAAGDTAYVFVINENERDNGNRDAYGNGSYDFEGISRGKEIVLGQSQ